MRRLFDLLGLKVLTSTDGIEIGTICDILIKNDTMLKVQGFILITIDEKEHLFLPWEEISIGKDCILVHSRESPDKFDLKNLEKDFLLKDTILDLRVYTNDGKELGLVKELFLSDSNRLVDGIACSDGLINDLLKGRTLYPLIGPIKINDDNLYVSKECIEEAIYRKEVEI